MRGMSAGSPPQVSHAASETEGGGIFSTTRWSVVVAARGDDEGAREALGALCSTYWFPVYALVRRRGSDVETARDFTQEFFARMLSRDGFAAARRARGRFRTFLAQSVRNFLSDEWDKATALKRGGGVRVLSLDEAEAEARYREAEDAASPDVVFDRQWAADLLTAARRRLEAEFSAEGKSAVLEVFVRMAGVDRPGLAEEAARLEMPLNTLKSHLRRARLRHGEIVRALVAETVESPAQVDEELRHLLAALE